MHPYSTAAILGLAMGRTTRKYLKDEVDILKADVLARAHVKWREAAGRDWDTDLAEIVAGSKPTSDEEEARAVALAFAHALTVYRRLRFPMGKKGHRKAKSRKAREKLKRLKGLKSKYRKQPYEIRAKRQGRRYRYRPRRRLSAVAKSIVDIIDRHFEQMLGVTEQCEGKEISLRGLLSRIGTPTPAMKPRVRVAAMPDEVWRAFGLKEHPDTYLLAIASLLLGNFPELSAKMFAHVGFSIADAIQAEAGAMRASIANVRKNEPRWRLVASRAAEEVARHLRLASTLRPSDAPNS